MARNARAWVLTAVGKDRPGIVARVTEILFRRGCNLEDSAMSRLGGEFAVMLVFSAPVACTEPILRSEFSKVARQLGLMIQVHALTGAERKSTSRGTPCLISVYGADHPGIVYHVASLLARLRVNITDLTTHLAPRRVGRLPAGRHGARGSAPLYLMTLEVECPSSVRASRLEQQLKRLAKRLRVEVTLRSAEAPVL